MILPIIAYGDAVLRKKAKEIDKDYPKLKELLANMWIRVFLVDTAPFSDDKNLTEAESKILKGFKKTFINAKISEESGEEWVFNEGCLSIPDVREDVKRKGIIRIDYLDENFKPRSETYDGLLARVIQHEYDHIEGILFTDKLSTLKKRLLKGRLKSISQGKILVDYRMRFPEMKRTR